MKRFILILICAVLLCLCAACSHNSKKSSLNTTDLAQIKNEKHYQNKRENKDFECEEQQVLIADVSHTGDDNIELIEEEIQRPTDDILFEAETIEDFEIIFQNPELPTGCEITALTMALNYYGYEVDKVTMAKQYLPCTDANLHYGTDGKLYGSDMDSYFIGNPASSNGYICGTDAIVIAANAYLTEHGEKMEAIDISGIELQELYQMVSKNIPVVVWATISMEDRRQTEGWYTESGKYVDWSTNDHGVVLIGYSDDTVTIADPIFGLVEYNRAQFEKVFASRNNQCVILKPL